MTRLSRVDADRCEALAANVLAATQVRIGEGHWIRVPARSQDNLPLVSFVAGFEVRPGPHQLRPGRPASARVLKVHANGERELVAVGVAVPTGRHAGRPAAVPTSGRFALDVGFTLAADAEAWQEKTKDQADLAIRLLHERIADLARATYAKYTRLTCVLGLDPRDDLKRLIEDKEASARCQFIGHGKAPCRVDFRCVARGRLRHVYRSLLKEAGVPDSRREALVEDFFSDDRARSRAAEQEILCYRRTLRLDERGDDGRLDLHEQVALAPDVEEVPQIDLLSAMQAALAASGATAEAIQAIADGVASPADLQAVAEAAKAITSTYPTPDDFLASIA